MCLSPNHFRKHHGEPQTVEDRALEAKKKEFRKRENQAHNAWKKCEKAYRKWYQAQSQHDVLTPRREVFADRVQQADHALKNAVAASERYEARPATGRIGLDTNGRDDSISQEIYHDRLSAQSVFDQAVADQRELEAELAAVDKRLPQLVGPRDATRATYEALQAEVVAMQRQFVK